MGRRPNGAGILAYVGGSAGWPPSRQNGALASREGESLHHVYLL